MIYCYYRSDKMDKRLNYFFKVYPIFTALTGDLIFYIAINTVFMTMIKGLTVSEFASLATISSICCLIFRSFIYKVIEKIGTIKSLQLSSLLMLLSSLLLTYGTHYITFVIAITLLEIGFIFNAMESVALKHNLAYQKKESQYLKIKSKVAFFYALATALIALISGLLFDLNHYLPMYLQNIMLFLCFLLSLFFIDMGEEESTSKVEVPNVKMNMNQVLVLIFVSYGILYGGVSIVQNNVKLLIQEVMLDSFTPEKIMYYLSIIVFISRMVRMTTSIIFERFVRFWGERVLLILSTVALFIPAIMLFSYYMPIPIIWKVIAMAIGFFIILGIREPFNIYIQDLTLKQCELEEQTKAVFNLAFARKIGGTVTGLAVTLLLLKLPLITVFYFLLAAYIINLLCDIRILKHISH